MDSVLQIFYRIRRRMRNSAKPLVLDCIDDCVLHEGKSVLEAALRTVLKKQSVNNSVFPPLPIGKYPDFDIEPPAFVEDYQIAERNFIAEWEASDDINNNNATRFRSHPPLGLENWPMTCSGSKGDAKEHDLAAEFSS